MFVSSDGHTRRKQEAVFKNKRYGDERERQKRKNIREVGVSTFPGLIVKRDRFKKLPGRETKRVL